MRGHRSTWPACCDVARAHLPPPNTMPHASGCCMSWDSPERFPPSCLCEHILHVTGNYSKKSRPELRSPEPCTAPAACTPGDTSGHSAVFMSKSWCFSSLCCREPLFISGICCSSEADCRTGRNASFPVRLPLSETRTLAPLPLNCVTLGEVV